MYLEILINMYLHHFHVLLHFNKMRYHLFGRGIFTSIFKYFVFQFQLELAIYDFKNSLNPPCFPPEFTFSKGEKLYLYQLLNVQCVSSES